jgi:hypothetical protein
MTDIHALKAQAEAMRRQWEVLNAQWVALYSQIVELPEVEASDNPMTQRIFKPESSPRHFMEPDNDQHVEEGPGDDSSRQEGAGKANLQRSARHGRSDSGRQRGTSRVE